MLIFTIIVFGLATVRTLLPMRDPDEVNFASIAVAATMIISYVWFLQQFVSVR